MPLTARELFAAGKVREAEKVLTAYLREHPSDKAQRTFLFELLCFAGEFARAERQLAAYRHPKFWQCIDTLRDRRILEDMWNKNEAPWKTQKTQ